MPRARRAAALTRYSLAPTLDEAVMTKRTLLVSLLPCSALGVALSAAALPGCGGDASNGYADFGLPGAADGSSAPTASGSTGGGNDGGAGTSYGSQSSSGGS